MAQHKELYRTPNVNENGDPYLRVLSNDGYCYAERAGVDSVAFILYDSANSKYGLISEYKPPINRAITTAFGGSLDKAGSLEDIVKMEVREEAGYDIANAFLWDCSNYFVSTQMNQFCYAFVVDITQCLKYEPIPTDKWELEYGTTIVWLTFGQILSTVQCWKAVVAATKHRIKYLGINV